MARGARGNRFLADFNRLKQLVGNDPENLDASRELSEDVQALCKDIAWHVRSFERVERSSQLAFTSHIAPASISARRDYDERWRGAVQIVADKDLMAFVRSLLEDLPGPSAQADDEKVAARGDELSAAIADWKYDANERTKWLNQIMDFAATQLEEDDCGDFEWISEGLEAWDTLATSGLNVADTLWCSATFKVRVARRSG